MPKLIHCSEPGCNQFISDPCGTITSLFELRDFLIDIIDEIKIETPKYNQLQKQIVSVNSQLQSYFETNAEGRKIIFSSLATLNKINFRKNQFKVLTLECSKGHRNVYLVDC